MTARHGIARVSLYGAIGGMLNACLCYAGLPIPVQERSASFHWHIIPAGLAHGSLLAIVATGSALLVARRDWALRWAAVPLVGWLGGYLSWIPLDLSAFGNPLSKALAWPVFSSNAIQSLLLAPFFYFGVVSALLYAWLLKRRSSTPRWGDMAAASCAGAVGSLWWWSQWGPWYFSLLHGGVWGCCVGWAVQSTETWGERRAAEQGDEADER